MSHKGINEDIIMARHDVTFLVCSMRDWLSIMVYICLKSVTIEGQGGCCGPPD